MTKIYFNKDTYCAVCGTTENLTRRGRGDKICASCAEEANQNLREELKELAAEKVLLKKKYDHAVLQDARLREAWDKWAHDFAAQLGGKNTEGTPAHKNIKFIESAFEKLNHRVGVYRIQVASAEKVRDAYMKGDTDAVMEAIAEMRSVWTKITTQSKSGESV